MFPVSAVAKTFAQYVSSAGPAPNCIRAKIVNTSPIEITTAGTCGRWRFIVATKKEARVSSDQVTVYSLGDRREETAKGRARTYIAIKYVLQLMGRSFHFMSVRKVVVGRPTTTHCDHPCS